MHFIYLIVNPDHFLDTNVKFSSMLYQQKFLASVLTKLGNEETAQSVISDLNQLRGIITSTNNLALHVAADWHKMGLLNNELNDPWQRIAKPGDAPCKEK